MPEKMIKMIKPLFSFVKLLLLAAFFFCPFPYIKLNLESLQKGATLRAFFTKIYSLSWPKLYYYQLIKFNK